MPLRARSLPSPLRRSLRHQLMGLALVLAAGARAAVPDAPPAPDAAMPAATSSVPSAAVARLPDCSRPLTLGLHEHGLLYASQTGEGIDKDVADEMMRRSGCHLTLTMLPRARIWQLVESGALDFTLSGITNAQRDRFATFAWYVPTSTTCSCGATPTCAAWPNSAASAACASA
jgi:hypothetical protein